MDDHDSSFVQYLTHVACDAFGKTDGQDMQWWDEVEHAVEAILGQMTTVDGWVWCERFNVPVGPESHNACTMSSRTDRARHTHRSLLLGPACEETNDG